MSLRKIFSGKEKCEMDEKIRGLSGKENWNAIAGFISRLITTGFILFLYDSV